MGYKYVSSGVTSTGLSIRKIFLHVLRGGMVRSTTVNSFSMLYVSSGGAAQSTVVNGG